MGLTYHVRDESDCSFSLGQKRESMSIDQLSEMAALSISLWPMLWPALLNEIYLTSYFMDQPCCGRGDCVTQ